MKINFMMIIFVTVVFLIISLGHFVVYRTFITAFGITNIKTINIIKVLMSLGAVSFIATTILTSSVYTKIGSLLYKCSALWLGILYLLFIASVIFAIIFYLNSFLGGGTFVSQISAYILFISALLLSVYGVINSYNIKVVEYNVPIDNLPESWEGKKIVMFSDSHLGNIRNINFAHKLVNKINEQNGDMVIIAGDYYDGPKVDSKKIAMTLKNINAKDGIYFAPGNHEDYGDSLEFSSALSSSGVVVLSNESVVLDKVEIAGLNYATGENPTLMKNVLEGISKGQGIQKILIKHAPTNLKEVSDLGYSLVLSGHVHNGQVWPGPIIAKRIYKEFAYGLNYLDSMAVVTSSGVGTWGPPQRLGTQSEIVVVNILKK